MIYNSDYMLLNEMQGWHTLATIHFYNLIMMRRKQNSFWCFWEKPWFRSLLYGRWIIPSWKIHIDSFSLFFHLKLKGESPKWDGIQLFWASAATPLVALGWIDLNLLIALRNCSKEFIEEILDVGFDRFGSMMLCFSI